MGKFTKVASDSFDELQMNAGVLLSSFDPTNPTEPSSDDIIATTTGGIHVVCEPTYSDFGEDVDNVPNNMKEYKHLDGWNCYMGFTSIKFNTDNVRLAVGPADLSGETYAASSDTSVVSGKTYYTRTGSGTAQSPYVYTPVASPTGNPSTSNYYEMTTPNYKVTPRMELADSDFEDALWWVGDKADGGCVAIKLLNARSTGGFDMQTTKNAKGTMSMTITGHVSISAQTTVPMEFYVLEAPAS